MIRSYPSEPVEESTERSPIRMKPVTGAVTVPDREEIGARDGTLVREEITVSAEDVVGYRFVSLANHRAIRSASASSAAAGW
jgi:hypothetical protein